MEKKTTNNISCRIFKEQILVINQLPEEDRAKVLYLAIMNSFNQFENQNDNQIENQNENAYISLSISLSNISKSILDLLSKNIVFKEYSNNYGGLREKAGRKPMGTERIPNDTERYPKQEHKQEQEYKQEQNNQITDKEKEYKYKGTIIKLNDKDYENWKNKYNLLDLDFELGQMDLSLQTEKYKTKQKDWFFMVQGWLNKSQKEKKEKNDPILIGGFRKSERNTEAYRKYLEESNPNSDIIFYQNIWQAVKKD